MDMGLKLILDTIGDYEFKEIPKETTEKLDDLSLTQKLKVVVMEIPGIDWTNLYVENGVVKLSGMAKSEKAIEECKRIISKTKGVKNVDDSQLHVKQPLPLRDV